MKDLIERLWVVLCFLGMIGAFPIWDPFVDQTSVNNLVPGGTHVESNVPAAFGAARKVLSVHLAGRPGNVTIDNHLYEPPVFYIFKRQLYYMKNETIVWPVNVHNVTKTHPLPMQLVVEEKQRGVKGTWRWEGTMLNFDLGGKRSPLHRLFFVCRINNFYNVFLSASPTPPPPDCEITTLHTFIHGPD